MGSPDPRVRLRLRPRFLLATALMVVTAVLASAWTMRALTRVGDAVGETLRQNDEATQATTEVATSLEREDDALLLVLAGDADARSRLGEERARVDRGLARLDAILDEAPEQRLVDELQEAIDGYRRASIGSFEDYHREANPLLRLAVARTAKLRDLHFESTASIAVQARKEVVSARGGVLGIGLAAFVVSLLLALHLAKVVIDPLTEMTRGARAMKEGDFEKRLHVSSGDELGELAAAFNEMAAHLAELRRSNIGEMLRAKATLEATIQALPDAVILLDARHRVLSLNRRARELLASDGRPDTIDAAATTFGGTTLSALATSGGSFDAGDLANALRVEREGTTRRFLARSLPVPELAENDRGTVLVLYDVTELARLDEMRVELIAVASHELRTPLTVLRMTLLMLQEESSSQSARERELVDTCAAGARELAETVDEFLDLTRIEAGQLRLGLETMSVRPLLEQALAHWHERASAYAVKLVLDAPTDIAVHGDAVRLRRVLDNLISNALKYSPDGSTVRLTARDVGGDLVRIAVVDAGRGVPDELRERVFDKFFRVEHHRPGTDVGTRGVGIGLYLCRQIIALHGGSIRCEANQDGPGTVFSFDLARTGERT